MTEETALARQETALANPKDFELAFDTYQKIQGIIDARLQDHIMTIRGKKFRKKQYWRAVSTAFNLTVKPLFPDEYFETSSGDWGYRSTYEATAPSGRTAVGDGTCMRSEKIVWEKDDEGDRTDVEDDRATAENATHHNVRGHANTRAFNRAVSNLVGFGEVSAEEMPSQRGQRPSSTKTAGGTIPFGKHKGKAFSEIPANYLAWMVSDKADKVDQSWKDEAAREMARRAKAESEPVDAEVVETPGDPDAWRLEAEQT